MWFLLHCFRFVPVWFFALARVSARRLGPVFAALSTLFCIVPISPPICCPPRTHRCPCPNGLPLVRSLLAVAPSQTWERRRGARNRGENRQSDGGQMTARTRARARVQPTGRSTNGHTTNPRKKKILCEVAKRGRQNAKETLQRNRDATAKHMKLLNDHDQRRSISSDVCVVCTARLGGRGFLDQHTSLGRFGRHACVFDAQAKGCKALRGLRPLLAFVLCAVRRPVAPIRRPPFFPISAGTLYRGLTLPCLVAVLRACGLRRAHPLCQHRGRRPASKRERKQTDLSKRGTGRARSRSTEEGLQRSYAKTF